MIKFILGDKFSTLKSGANCHYDVRVVLLPMPLWWYAPGGYWCVRKRPVEPCCYENDWRYQTFSDGDYCYCYDMWTTAAMILWWNLGSYRSNVNKSLDDKWQTVYGILSDVQRSTDSASNATTASCQLPDMGEVSPLPHHHQPSSLKLSCLYYYCYSIINAV